MTVLGPLPPTPSHKGRGSIGRYYLDANASEPLRPEARAAVLDALRVTGNPSSVHGEGR